MKTKEEIIMEAYYDIMYSTKTLTEVLEEVYECGKKHRDDEPNRE